MSSGANSLSSVCTIFSNGLRNNMCGRQLFGDCDADDLTQDGGIDNNISQT